MSITRSFGPFVHDPARGLLLRDGAPVTLGRRATAILALLLARRGEVVTKDALIDAAWGDRAIEESNLSVQVAQLRRALGRTEAGGEWIATVQRIGYRFVPDEAALPVVIAPGHVPVPAVAIGDFVDLGLDGDGRDQAGRLREDLRAVLARFGALRVAASDAAVAYLLDGSVWREGGRLQIAVRLTETATGIYRWAERFTLDGGDLHHGRERIVARIASVVEGTIETAEIELARTSQATGQDAAALFRRAQFHLRTSRPGDYAIATDLIERALVLEPDNVACLAAACEALHHRIGMGWPALSNGDAGRCLDYAMRGLSRPVTDSWALALFGISIFRTFDQDWGYELMQRAAALNPASLTALVYAGTSSMHWGNVAEAEAHFRHALDLDPNHPAQGFVMGGLARVRMMEGAFEDALEWARRAFLANPNYGAAHWTLVAANAQLGRHDAADRMLTRFRRMQPGVTVSAIRTGQATRTGRMASTLEGLELAGLQA